MASTLSNVLTHRQIYLKLLLFPLLLCFLLNPQSCKMEPSYEMSKKFADNLGEFSMDMYSKLVENEDNANKNIIFSPISIQTCVAMARVGAEGETAKELDRGLRLVSSDVNTIAESFATFLEESEKSTVLKIANKIYIMEGYKIKKEYNDLVTKLFYSTAESIDFSQSGQAAKTMNDWVESKTNHLIKDLISPGAIGSDTRLVLLNAIHFKGQWVHKFPEHATRQDNFYLNEVDSVKVPMMHLKERFRYADLPELEATALEMPYKDTDLSMLVILPNSRTGLKALEQKLRSLPIADITKKMYSTQVIVKFPKFKAEFSVELNEQLEKMGMSRMFSDNAEFGKMLDSNEPLTVSKVVHKAFIEVNEEGTEAAAATVLRIAPVMGILRKRFFANKPFVYIIKSQHNFNLFSGRFALSHN